MCLNVLFIFTEVTNHHLWVSNTFIFRPAVLIEVLHSFIPQSFQASAEKEYTELTNKNYADLNMSVHAKIKI